MDKAIPKKIKALSARYEQKVIGYRRHIHMNPEIGLEEKETAAFIAAALRDIGLVPQENIGGYGVAAVIEGRKGSGKCIGLRADIDALAIPENTGLPFSSRNEGVCHACGHDMHAAMLLGVAHTLYDLRDEFAGSVKLVFQPAEEWVLCGGAIDMIRDGVMENPHVDAMIAQHVDPFVEVGKAVARSGSETSSTDRLFVTIKGKACHGARPDGGIDGILIAAKFIDTVQSIVSRNVSPTDMVAVTFGVIQGGERYDILAKEVRLEGTYRTHSNEWRKKVPELVERIARGISEALGGAYEFETKAGYPPLHNDPGMCRLVIEAAAEILGEENIIKPETSGMGGEDFAFFSQMVPSMYFRIGVRAPEIPEQDVKPLHNNAFNPDERGLVCGINVMANSALKFLAR
jgi:amidohydrolase